MAERKLEVRILGDSRSLERAFGSSTRSAQKFERGMSGVGRAAAGLTKAFGIAAAGIGVLAVMGARELSEQAKVSAQTATVLRNLGKTAGVTTRQVEGLASALQASTGAADDEVQAASNVLLRFGLITKTGKAAEMQLRAMTTTALDLSVATGKDLTASAQALGRALADPTKAAGALRRAGIILTAQQKEQIKTMAESGKGAQAQAMVMDLVNARVRGSADAFGKTLPGQIEKAKRSLEDLAENAIGALAPALSKVLPVLLQGIRSLAPVIGQVATILADLASQLINSPAFREFAATLRDIAIQGVQLLAGALRILVPLVVAVVGPVASLVGAIMRSRVAMTALVAAFAAFASVSILASLTATVAKFRELAIVTAATSGVSKLGGALSLLATGFSGVSAKSVGLAPGLTAAGAGLSRVTSAATLAKGAAGALGRGLSSALGGPVGITIGVVAGLAAVIGGDLIGSFMRSKDPAGRYADAMGRVAGATAAAKDSLAGLAGALIGVGDAQDRTRDATVAQVEAEKRLRTLQLQGITSGPAYAKAERDVATAKREHARAMIDAGTASDTYRTKQDAARGVVSGFASAITDAGRNVAGFNPLLAIAARGSDEARNQYQAFILTANTKILGSDEVRKFQTNASEMATTFRTVGTPEALNIARALDGLARARDPQAIANYAGRVVSLMGGSAAEVAKIKDDINRSLGNVGNAKPSTKWKDDLLAALGVVGQKVGEVVSKFAGLLGLGKGKGKGIFELPTAPVSFSGGPNATAFMRSQRSAVGGAMGGLSALARQGFIAKDPEAQGIATRAKARAKDYRDLQRATLEKAALEAETDDDKKRAALDLQAFEDEILEQGVEDRATKYAEDMDNLGVQFARGEISAETFNAKLGELLGPNSGETYGNLFGVKWRDAFDAVTGPTLALIREGLGGAPGPAPVEGPPAEEAPPAAGLYPKGETFGPWASKASRDKAWANLDADLKRRGGKTRTGKEGAYRYGIKINPLADGGIIRRAILAGEAGPEAVVPLTGTRGRAYMAAVMHDVMRSRGSGTTVVVNVAGNEFSAEEFARKIGPELRRQVSLTGSW